MLEGVSANAAKCASLGMLHNNCCNIIILRDLIILSFFKRQ